MWSPSEGWLTRTTSSWFKCTTQWVTVDCKSWVSLATSSTTKSQAPLRKFKPLWITNMEFISLSLKKLMWMVHKRIRFIRSWGRILNFIIRKRVTQTISLGAGPNSWSTAMDRWSSFTSQLSTQRRSFQISSNFSWTKVKGRCEDSERWPEQQIWSNR